MSIPAVPAPTILVVEDDPNQFRLYGKVLKGFRLTCVVNATAALKALEERLPDIIILDHVLAGGERGADFLPKLKELAAHVPIVIVSGTLDIRASSKPCKVLTLLITFWKNQCVRPS